MTVALGVLAATLAISPPTATAGPPGVKVTPVPVSPPVDILSYPARDAAGAPLGDAQWRVVSGTGNCCENYIATTSQGRILDFGGDYIFFSDDLGETWSQVRPPAPIIGGEGTLVQAPNGDIAAATWSPYVGDRVLAFKLEAAEGAWYYNENIVKTPFYDRPWLAVIPGPFTVGSTTAPYVSVLTSNFTEDVQYYSLDGLNYTIPHVKAAESVAGSERRWLDLPSDPSADWIQPISEMDLAPLSGGGGLARVRSGPRTGVAVLRPPQLRWSSFAFENGEVPKGRFLTDSTGAIHDVQPAEDRKSFTWRVSRTGGRTWEESGIALPVPHEVEDWDFKVNAQLGLAALGVHAHNTDSKKDQDLVYELALGPGAPTVVRLFFVGLGDLEAGSSVTATNERFDFSTIGILPDRTIVTTFLDSEHRDPALAILVAAPPLPPPVVTAPPPSTIPASLPRQPGRGAGSRRPSLPPGCIDRVRPTAAPTRARRLPRRRFRLAGRARDTGCAGVARVEVAVARRQTGRRARGRCRHLTRRRGLARPRPCGRVIWLRARGRTSWRYGRKLRIGGTYIVRVRAVDLAGNRARPRRFAVRVR